MSNAGNNRAGDARSPRNRDENRLLQIIAPHFVAGLVINRGRCVMAAPILRRYCLNKTVNDIEHHYQSKGYKVYDV